MVKIVDGSLLDAPEDILCHQVNCCGVMGSGVALALREKYPSIFPYYQMVCSDYSTECLLGMAQMLEQMDNHIVANLFGQITYGRDKEIVYTNYEALEIAFVRVREYALKNGCSIAIPYRIGCGLANGNWDVVYQMIKRVFYNIDVTLYQI